MQLYKLQMIRNYYESLGVGRQASSELIADSYRKLALRFHPKTTREPQEVAAKMFSELAQAYQVLSDPVKRAYYDKHGLERLKESFYEEGGLKAGYRFADNPQDIFDSLFADKEAVKGVLDLQLTTEGSLFGHAFGGLENKQSFGCEPLVVKIPCALEELYRGATKTVQFQRKVLGSDGRSTSVVGQQRTLHIKPGYHAGTVICCQGAGHQTVHRTCSDLFFAITELPHALYARKGDDLIYTHSLSLADALECRPVQLTTLDGRHLSIPIDQIPSPQILHEVGGEGLINEKTNKRGNLYIRFNIYFPSQLPQHVKKELRTLLV